MVSTQTTKAIAGTHTQTTNPPAARPGYLGRAVHPARGYTMHTPEYTPIARYAAHDMPPCASLGRGAMVDRAVPAGAS